ncbi:DUF2397 family protein [Streptomyces sp. CLV115]|uniref:DUF2397 family protein n=1 Tax=Streptomyces sp. CLV115 TaxID=3138502 RepID=UPI00313D5E3A
MAAVRSTVVDVGRALQLPSRLLDGVERTLRDLLGHLREDHGLLPGDLEDVCTRIDELQRVTADFYAALATMVQADVTGNEVFGENRDRVVEALRQFPREYGRGLPRVETALAELREAGFARTVEAAVEHAGPVDAADQQHWIDERLRRLADLESWFQPDGSVHRLIDSAGGVVHTMLVAIGRRYMARRRGSDPTRESTSGPWPTASTGSRKRPRPAASTRPRSGTCLARRHQSGRGRRGPRHHCPGRRCPPPGRGDLAGT